MHVFHGEKMLPSNATDGRLLITEAVCRKIKMISASENEKKKCVLSAVYEYEVGEKKYYKSIYFKKKKKTSEGRVILYPEKIIVFYDEKHPRFSYWERNTKYQDLEYKSLNKNK